MEFLQLVTQAQGWKGVEKVREGENEEKGGRWGNNKHAHITQT
jgi:hypothetical protein